MIGMWEEICRDGLSPSTLKSTSEENRQVMYTELLYISEIYLSHGEAGAGLLSHVQTASIFSDRNTRFNYVLSIIPMTAKRRSMAKARHATDLLHSWGSLPLVPSFFLISRQ